MYRVNKELLSSNEAAVWSLLEGRHGSRNAITSTEIKKKTGLNRFMTCKAVQSLRLQHNIPVVTNKYGIKKGYFLPENNTEIKETIEEFTRQAETLLAVIEILGKAAV